jgi:hypothetical protein
MSSTPRKEEMCNYSYLLFLSSIIAADNNMALPVLASVK